MSDLSCTQLRHNEPALLSVVGGVDIPLALVRFIIPLVLVGVVSYVFRLFGFGWRIYKPRDDSGTRGINDMGHQLELLRRGDYLDYVDIMGSEIGRNAGNMAEFRRLRGRYIEISRSSSHLTDSDASADMDSVISRMIALYREATGRDGITFTGRRRYG